jgi:hypothetical protein
VRPNPRTTIDLEHVIAKHRERERAQIGIAQVEQMPRAIEAISFVLDSDRVPAWNSKPLEEAMREARTSKMMRRR